MSVGYDLAGIRSPKIDGFLDDMKDASNTEIFRHCHAVLARRLGDFSRFTSEDLARLSPSLCNNVTISTMHGCPAEDIEAIVLHLMENKGLHLLLKCNPTLVGFDHAKKALDALGFNYLHFEQTSFDNDLKYDDAVPMLRRLLKRAAALGLFFGVKLTNTFAVKADRGELPDRDIYMSGRALLPLSLWVAVRLREDFGDKLPISYCGGVDAKNIALLAKMGLFPITVCTELLKPGGYEKLYAMATALEGTQSVRATLQSAILDDLAEALYVLARNVPTPHRALQALDADAKANCRAVCGICASVCPNRANVIITVDGRRQMLHLDGPCNECGNCASCCTEKTLPYRNKLTVFTDRAALEDSQNAGFTFLPESGRFLLRWADICREVDPADEGVPPEVGRVMVAVRDRYPWLLYKQEKGNHHG
jgi:putative selenate reductase